ncbi:MAG: type II secretion system F family protein [Bdellovibrionales bacterium]|nr:type II secretion system F family protein [Bdellovibrionales bacterium]
MDITLLIILLVVLMLLIGVLVVYLSVNPSRGRAGGQQQIAVSDSLRSLVSAQRQQDASRGGAKKNLALAAAAEDQTRKTRATSGRMTLEKRIRYARWSITPIQFRFAQIVLALSVYTVARVYGLAVFLQLIFLWLAPSSLSSLLNLSIRRRFEAFDADYPVLLMQYVSLLKTGMNTMSGLEAAAKGLPVESVVRAEVELMIDRLRLGMTEEQAINAFGEDIAHPELELFVQSLLLSRRVGGTLSTTLERLARQVRKRQQFRKQAVSAVGMERGSIYAIALIMTLLIIYLGFSQPDLVIPAFTDPTGSSIFQTGLGLIIGGFVWSRKVTNIRV